MGDQPFVTLLLYLDDICIFAPTIDVMLDQIELVFDRLKQFNLKIKPKKGHFFSIAESVQLCYTSHFVVVVVVVSGSVGLDVVNKLVNDSKGESSPLAQLYSDLLGKDIST